MMTESKRPTLFNKETSNPNRVQGGSIGGLRGRTLPKIWAKKLNEDIQFRKAFCRKIQKPVTAFLRAIPSSAIPRSRDYAGHPKEGKISFVVFWKDGTQTTFRTRSAKGGQIHLEVPNAFIRNFAKRFGVEIPSKVKEAIQLFTAAHPNTEAIWHSLPQSQLTPFSRQKETKRIKPAERIRNLEAQYFHRLVLSSIYVYDPKMAIEFVDWLAEETPRLFEYCFIRGGFPSEADAVDWLLFPERIDDVESCTFVDLKALSHALSKLSSLDFSKRVAPGDSSKIGSTIALPFGKLQYHEKSLQFRFDKAKLEELWHVKRSTFGSRQKNRGHRNEVLVADALRDDKGFLSGFQHKAGKTKVSAVSVSTGGIHAKNLPAVISIHGRKTTPPKTDIVVRWSDGSRSNISLKLEDGQADLRTVDAFCAGLSAQFGISVPPDVHRALALFFGCAPDSEDVFRSIPRTVVDEKTWRSAEHQNHRLVYSMLNAYRPIMAKGMLDWIAAEIERICRFCFSSGTVKDKQEWADLFWHRNLVDPALSSFDYLIPIDELCAAVRKACAQCGGVVPGPKFGGSSIHLPFGHLEYLQGKMEFYQSIKKIERLLL